MDTRTFGVIFLVAALFWVCIALVAYVMWVRRKQAASMARAVASAKKLAEREHVIASKVDYEARAVEAKADKAEEVLTAREEEIESSSDAQLVAELNDAIPPPGGEE
jgi:predicted Holliday junction resolvase-like endonuclease